MQAFASPADQPSLTVGGLISGTSADGIDVAVVEFSGGLHDLDWRVLRTGNGHYKPEVQSLVKRAPELSAGEVSWLNRAVAQDFAAAAREVGLDGVDLLGSHGQTLFHHSGQSALKSTLQVGCGDTLAYETGLPVIHNFRAADIARGGEGAPLTPGTDWVLYRRLLPQGSVVVNLGGIANVTYFGREMGETRGFDTGPANCVIDRLTRLLTRGAQAFDEGGRIAASGQLNDAWLARLIEQDSFVRQPPPKSTGFESYGDAFVERVITDLGPPSADLIATMTAFSAECLAVGLRHFADVSSVVLAGGGAHNPVLVREIERRSGLKCVASSDLEIPADFREAIAFAALGYLFARGLRLDFRGITGGQTGMLGQLSVP